MFPFCFSICYDSDNNAAAYAHYRIPVHFPPISLCFRSGFVAYIFFTESKSVCDKRLNKQRNIKNSSGIFTVLSINFKSTKIIEVQFIGLRLL